MDADSMESLLPGQLARLLDIGAPAAGPASPDPNPRASTPGEWSAEEAADALRHLLDTPLPCEIANAAGMYADVSNPCATGIPALRAALTVPSTDLAVLHAIKQFARQIHPMHGHPLAGDPATVIYYAAIAAAEIHRHTRITTLPEARMAAGFQWAREQRGAEGLQALFDNALGMLLRPPRTGPTAEA